MSIILFNSITSHGPDGNNSRINGIKRPVNDRIHRLKIRYNPNIFRSFGACCRLTGISQPARPSTTRL